MEEKLISFETAKLAYQKQFQEYTQYFYTEENGLCSIDSDGEILNMFNYDLTLKEYRYDCNGDFWYKGEAEEFESYDPIKYPAPTQSLLQKWLREVHNIHIVTNPTIEMYWTFGLINLGNESIELNGQIIYDGSDYNTYEEALEIGLQEALKLI